MRTSKGKPADPNWKCEVCGLLLKGATVDEQYEDYRRHMATRVDDAKNGLVNHNSSPAQWGAAYKMIEAGKEKAKVREEF